MYHHMYGKWSSPYDWLWMTMTMLAWLVALGAVVYGAVRLAINPRRHEERPPLDSGT